MTTSNFEQLERELLDAISAANDLVALDDVRVSALGKKGRISELMKGLGDMPPEERKAFGQAVNGLKERVGTALAERKDVLQEAELSARLSNRPCSAFCFGPHRRSRAHPLRISWSSMLALSSDTRNSPPSGIASRELTARLMSVISSSSGSTLA